MIPIDLKEKIDALAADVVAATSSGETTLHEVAISLLVAHRDAGGSSDPFTIIGTTECGSLSLELNHQGELRDHFGRWPDIVA